MTDWSPTTPQGQMIRSILRHPLTQREHCLIAYFKEQQKGGDLISPDAEPGTDISEELNSLTVAELQGLCRQKGLKIRGTKNELIERISA